MDVTATVNAITTVTNFPSSVKHSHNVHSVYTNIYLSGRSYFALQLQSSNLALSSRGSQRCIENPGLIKGQLPALRTTPTAISTKNIALKIFSELRGELPLVEQILWKLVLEAPHNVLSNHGEKLECTGHCVSMLSYLGATS